MSTPKLDFLSIGQSIDGTNYCAGVEALAENVLEDNENDAVIVFPSKTGWARLRSSNYRAETDNMEMQLPFPLYKIKRIMLKPAQETFTVKVAIGTDYNYQNREVNISEFKNELGQPLELDLTSMFVTVEEWNALPGYSGENHSKLAQDTTFFYKMGESKIQLSGSAYLKGWWVFADDSPKQARVISRLRYLLNQHKYTRTFGYDETGINIPQTFDFEKDIGIGKILPYTNDYRDLEYRIEYVPITPKTKIRARKTAKQEVEYLQPFNQRAEINAASAFGKSMWLTAQKTGTEQITVVKNYTKLDDIPPLGAVVRHNGKKYRLVANSYTQTNTIYIQVAHTLSENWTSKSKHVAVNQKYRNYSIPQDMLWRNMYWEDYITVSSVGKTAPDDATTGKLMDKAIQLFYVPSTNDSTIDTFAWKFEEKQVGNFLEQGVVVPCSTMGIANSMVFSASFKDNLSAGLRENYTEGEDWLLEEALYCKEDGTLMSAQVILADGYDEGASEETARRLYPSIITNTTTGVVYNAPNTPIFDKNFYVDKDPGEAIKFTYQVHFVTEGDCVVGNKLAEHNPLIKRYEKSNTARRFKVWLLKDHIREGEDILVPTTQDLALSQTANGDYFTVWHPQGGNNARVVLKDNTKALLKDYKAWAITDNNNCLYVGRNENQEGVVHLCISHKRI